MKKKILTTLITLIVFAVIISIFWIIISFIMHFVADNHEFNPWSVRTFFISILALFISVGITYILKDNEPPPPPIVEKPKKVVKVSKFQQRLEEMQREKNKNKKK